MEEDVIHSALNEFQTISLEEMEGVKLMDRYDTKYTFHRQQLPIILEQSAPSYRVLEIHHKHIFHYNNLYFDTPQKTMYMHHHNGKQNRYKIRIREYIESGIFFLEIKFKSNTGRTRKKRLAVERMEEPLTEGTGRYIETLTPFNYRELEPVLWIKFSRITLVHKTVPERITIDTDLEFRKNGHTCGFPNLVITEVKQCGRSGSSDLIRIFKNQKIYPCRVSKYCIGTADMNPGIKYNRFKPKILSLQKFR